MNSRQRFLNSIKGEPIDRLFRYEHGIWPTTRERWLKEGYPEGVGCYPDTPGFADYFEMDPIVRIPINSGYTNSPYHPRFQQQIVKEDHTHRLYVDEDGITKRVLVANSDTSMPQFVRFPVESREDWQILRERLNPGDALARIGDPVPLRELCANPMVPTLLPICGIFGHARNLFGDEGLSYVIYDDPDLLREILDNWCALYTELISQLTGLISVDSMLIWEDMCYKSGPLIDPRQFQSLMLPRYKQLIGEAKSHGIQAVIVDSDGDVSKMIPLFLEAGVDCLMPFEVQAGMDVVKIREDYGRSFCIMGGINKRALVQGKQSIEGEVARVVPFFLRSGRFIPTLDHTVPPDVPLENFVYYLQVLRSYEDGHPIP